MKPITIDHAAVVDAATLPPVDSLEATGKVVWLSKSCRCRTFGLVGVPSGALDLVIDERLLEAESWRQPADDRDVILLTVGRKAGMYNGRIRRHITIRLVRRADTPAGWGQLDIETTLGGYDLGLATTDGLVWSDRFARQGGTFDPHEAHRIIHWHFARYFPRLDRGDPIREEVDALAFGPVAYWLTHPESGEAMDPRRVSIAAANRAANRALYRLFRDAGWRLLTAREAERLQLKGGHWVRPEVYDAAQARLHAERGYGRQFPHRRGSPGCSEATERAAWDERGTLDAR